MRIGVIVGVLVSGFGGGCLSEDPPVPRRDLQVLQRAGRKLGQRSAKDSRCVQKRSFYRDADGDGFGDPRKQVLACQPPPGFVDNRDDCYDRNRRVKPGQRDYYAEHRGDGRFDYDCDGQETRRFTNKAFCRVKERGGCAVASGWVGRGRIPRCGEPGIFAWKVCREHRIVRPPPGAVDGGVPLSHSAGALVPGAKQSQFFKCGGRKLPWKKRQLCR